jgi:triosephosphate isomerase
MTDAIRPLIAGNWKMNGLKSSQAEFDAMREGAASVSAKADLLVCPPASLIAGFAERAKGSKIAVASRRECLSTTLPRSAISICLTSTSA